MEFYDYEARSKPGRTTRPRHIEGMIARSIQDGDLTESPGHHPFAHLHERLTRLLHAGMHRHDNGVWISTRGHGSLGA